MITDTARHDMYLPTVLAMPFDHGCRFRQHDGVQGLRPSPVKPQPESVCVKEFRTTWALAPHNARLLSKVNERKFKIGAATNTKREQESEGEKNRDHVRDGAAVARKSLGFSTLGFEHGQVLFPACSFMRTVQCTGVSLSASSPASLRNWRA
jgi:hypothetical protein